MTQQQRAFYEIERPPTVNFIVMVQPDQSTGNDLAECQYPGCEGDKDKKEEDVYGCEVCGGWYCFEHIGANPVCYTCQTLPPAIQTEVKVFREKLNALR